MRILLLAVMAALAVLSSAREDTVSCDEVLAYIVDGDPVDVRVEPSEVAGIIAVIEESGNEFGTTVQITGSDGEWIRVTRADTPDDTTFDGVGWVHNSHLRTEIQPSGQDSTPLFETPSAEAPVVRLLRHSEIHKARKSPAFLACH
ncbi:SH3 domain-containing protein [Marimonas arenosa]|uniref:SH3 domain-containing protein n=1 Tax=Marimonas arenosa TaxID=1795305 RepID=A0AAE4B577_9RHOB|nr:SH3 domain-containing protein [Marimonas arenosa]MDQ2088971.1 SH3 domain-containing protein [Marimonas arenosa]